MKVLKTKETTGPARRPVQLYLVELSPYDTVLYCHNDPELLYHVITIPCPHLVMDGMTDIVGLYRMVTDWYLADNHVHVSSRAMRDLREAGLIPNYHCENSISCSDFSRWRREGKLS